MLELIVYDDIRKKNELERAMRKPLSGTESLTRTLDMMDFIISFRKNYVRKKDNIDWIILEMKEQNSSLLKRNKSISP